MRKLLMASVLSIATMTAGCASGALGKLVTPNTVLIAQIGFDVAVGAVCGPDTALGKAKAVSLKTVATELLAVDTGSTAPLVSLEQSLQAKIASLNLPPADATAAQTLLLVINQTVGNLINKPTTSTATTPTTASTAQVAIATVLQQVINATAAYGV